MSERWARSALQIYRWAGVAAYPFIGSYVRIRASRGKEERHRLGERYGRASAERPEGPLVWVHAASLGETSAVVGLIQRLHEKHINVVLTTGTVTSAALARERLGNLVIHQYVPLDLRPAIGRFLEHWKPDLSIFVESEIWPMTILELEARRIPQVLINGRMSDRSFASWRKRLPLAESLFENFAHVAAQSDVDAGRFRELGARPVTMTGNLKVDVAIPSIDPAVEAKLPSVLGNRPVWAAISTHPGEEIIAARVHRALKKRWPGLLTIIVPRHPERAGEVYKQLTEMGLNVVQRTTHKLPTEGADIFLGDTIGEMGLYLRMAPIAFVGRSLAKEVTGGQNPLEPAVLDTAILAGPNIGNFAEAYGRLVEARGARLVDDEIMLAKSVHHLFSNPNLRKSMALAASRVVSDMEGAFEETWATLQPYVQPLIVSVALNGAVRRNEPMPDEPAKQQKGKMRIGWK